jgi:hypothetical protein
MKLGTYFLIILIILGLFNIFSSRAQTYTPSFTKNDFQIPELGAQYFADKGSYGNPYQTAQEIGLDCLYHTDGVNAWFKVTYCANTSYANELWDLLTASYELTQERVTRLQNDPRIPQFRYNITEAIISPNYKSILSYDITGYDGRRLIRVDDHFIVKIYVEMTDGPADELKRICDVLENHGALLHAYSGNFVISNVQTDVFVQRGGIGPWIAAQKGMQVYPLDAVKANGTGGFNSQSVEIAYYGPSTNVSLGSNPMFGMILGGGQVVLETSRTMPTPTIGLSVTSDPANAKPGDIVQFMYYSHNPLAQNSGWRYIECVYRNGQSYRFSPKGTEFTLEGDSSHSTLSVFEGSVEVSSSTGTDNLTAGTNQNLTVSANGVTTGPNNFDPSTVDHWWTSVLTSAPNSPSPSVPEMAPAIPSAAVIIVAFTVVLFRKNGFNTTHKKVSIS